MRGNEAEPLLLEEGGQVEGVPEAEEPVEEGSRGHRRDRGGAGEGKRSKPAAGGGSSRSALASKDDSGCTVSTSAGGQSVGRGAAEAPLSDPKKVSAATAPGPENHGEDEEVAVGLMVSSSVHFESKKRQLPLWLVLADTALDVQQFLQTELELGVWSVLVLRHGPLAMVSLLMAVKDCIDEVTGEMWYQYRLRLEAQREEISPGLLWSSVLIPLLVHLRILPKASAPSGTLWWTAKLHHAVRIMTIARLETLLNLMILLLGGSVALYTVAKAAFNGVVDTLAIVTAVNAVQTSFFILYKCYRQRRRMRQLEEKLRRLREDRSLGWDVREKLQQLQQNRQVSLSEKVMRFHDLFLEYPEYFFADNNCHESEARYIDVHSVPSDPARTGARGGLPAVEDVSKLLGLKLDGCKDEADVAARADSAENYTHPALDLALSGDEDSAILLVQGEAGTGKSTLAKHVALRATQAALKSGSMSSDSGSETATVSAVAPLVVYLHCAQHQVEGNRVSVRRYLESLLVGDNSHVSDKDWKGFVEETPIILVLDAYDEADSRFTLLEVLERDGLTNARSLRIVATARSGTFETDDTAKETFSCEINGRRVSPTMRWLRPIGDEEQRSSALAPLEATDDLWQTLHWKHPGLARVATTPLMAGLVAQAHNERALENLGRENCGDRVETKDGGDEDVEATLGSRIYKNRVRRRAHLISWHLKRQVEIGFDSLHPFADIDLVLHKLLLGEGSTSTSAIPSMLKEAWMKAGQLVARKLASLMWLRDTTVLRVTPPKVPEKDDCCFASLWSILPSTLSSCCSGASVDGSYSRLDTEVEGATERAEEKDVNDDVGQHLRDYLYRALPVELQAGMEEVDMHVMLLYLLGFCCSLKILRATDAGTCEVAFTHDTFRACRLAEAMASQNDSWSAGAASASLWACRLLLAHEHKDLINLLADIALSSVPFQNDFLWRCVEESKLQTVPGDHAGHSHSRHQASANDSSQGNQEKPKSVAAANAAMVLACAQAVSQAEI